MTPGDGRVDELAGAILDGTAIDWASVESSADAGERELLDQLKLVAILADIHRRPPLTLSTNFEAPPAVKRSTASTQRWGHLHVLEPIGRGAFGEVYRAWDTRLDREVALKLLPAGAGADGSDARASSFIHEGRLLARVRHPNVVTIYGAERIGSTIGLWMELVQGQTLQQLIEQGTSFSPAEVIAIGIELCRAVEAVHAAGLLHRDIKPHNVMRAGDGRLVLMDFGTGREVDDGADAKLAGTPLYLAPEVLRGNEATVRSDIYSLGVLLYHLLTRSYPVRAASLRDLRLAHAQGARPDLRSVRPDVQAGLARTIARATEAQPERRYATARDLGDGLLALAAQTTQVAWTRRLTAAVALLLVVAGVWEVRARQLRWTTSPMSLLAGIGNDPTSASSAAPAATVPAPIRSVAVLPFKPLVAAEGDERLQLGMTEAVINQLSRLRALRVEPLARVRRYGAREQDPLEAGRALGVEAVLEGYFQLTGSGVQVRARLLRTLDGTALAASQWDEPFSNILEVQTRLAESLAEALEITLTPAERSRFHRRDTTSPEALRHYLFGRYHMEVRSLERMRLAVGEFRKALALDPGYARAHAALSLALTHTAWLGERGIDVMAAAKTAAMKALAIDDTVALAHTALAVVLESFEYDYMRSQAEHLRAMALDDEDLWVLRAYGAFLLRRDAFDEALEVIRQALELDPASPLTNRHHAMMLYTARRYDECVAVSHKTLPLDPNNSSLALKWLAKCLEQQGKARQAIEAYERGRAANGNPDLAGRMTGLFVARGWNAYWREQLRLVKSDVESAAAHVRLGDLDEALQRLERWYETRQPWLGFTNMPEWDPLRSDLRFGALRLRAGMSDELYAQLAAARASARASPKP